MNAVNRPQLQRDSAAIICALSSLVGVVAAIADLLLLYAPGFSINLYEAVLTIPPARVQAGSYLGVLVIPLYIFGYWVIYEQLKPAGLWRSVPVLFIGIYGAALGSAFHAVVGFAARVVAEQASGSASPEQALDPYRALVVPLFILVHLLVIVGTVWLCAAIWGRRTLFPRWMILLSPGILAGLLFAVSLVAPTVGDFLQPTALNLAHSGFFAGAGIVLWKQKLPEFNWRGN